MRRGKGAFGHNTVSDTLVKILEREPNWHALPDATPPTIRRLLQRCLEKNSKHRLHDIADARIEIDDALAEPVRASEARGRGSSPTPAGPIPDHTHRQQVWMVSALALLVLTGAVAFTLAYLRPSVGADDATQFVLLPPEGAAFG